MLFTAAPRPSAALLVRGALRAPGADIRRAAELWRPENRNGNLHWFSRGAWAMAQAAAATGRPAPLVWLPDYFCRGAEAALRRSGARIAYYPVTESMTPDWPTCRAMAESAPPDMFVLVHTFGAENDLDGARAFADEHGALLLEDAAHVLRPAGRIGQTGDAVFFSPHKWLALPDGAVLWLREGLTGASDVGAPDADGRADTRPGAGGWAAKRMAQALIPAALQPKSTSRGPQRFLDDPPPGALSPPGISPLAAAMLAELNEAALAAVAEKRRANHRAWADGLNPRADVSVLETGAAAPYRCVLDASDPARAEALFHALRRAGVPAESWPDMPPEVMAAPGRHAAALNLRRRLVLAPVHQNTDENAIRRAAAALPESF
ncbi:MAG: DegT/DnrJ/EryC1/StrS family aminotransferase [Rhodospirillales bacterium]